MRKAFVNALCALAARDPRVVLLTADADRSVLEPFAERFPDRVVHVTERNMIGLATDLARQGFVPFANSIATFASMRCYEQFRNGPVQHSLPVRVVGPTRHAAEDLAIARTMSGVTVVAPADGAQTRTVIEATASLPGPVYLRIDEAEVPDIAELRGRFAFDEPILLRSGRAMLILSSGSIVAEALEAAEHLSSASESGSPRGSPRGGSPAVAMLAHLSFEANQSLADLLARYPEVVTLEEASIVGGLGSLVSETIADFGLPCRLLRLGVRSPLQNRHGSRHRLDAVSVASQAAHFSHRKWAA